MNKNIHTHIQRPYWHVDLKWIFGIGSYLILVILVLCIGFYQLTTQKVAVAIISNGAAAIINPEASENTNTIVEIKQKMDTEHTDIFYPFPDHSIVITREDVNTLSAKEIENKVYMQLAEAIYNNKLTTVDASGQSQNSSLQKFGVLAVFTSQFHNNIGSILLVLIFPLLLFLSLTIYFSAGYGRLISPAIVILIATGPLCLVTLITSALLHRSSSQIGSVVDQSGRVDNAISTVLPITTTELVRTYGLISLIAIILFVIATIGKVLQIMKNRSSNLALPKK